MTFEFLNPAVVLPKFNVVTVDHLPGAFSCAVVVIADEIDGFHEMTVTANKVSSIVRHNLRSLTPSAQVRRRASRARRIPGGTRYDHRVNAATLLAFEGAVVGSVTELSVTENCRGPTVLAKLAPLAGRDTGQYSSLAEI
jgi:hypothetical protein